MKTIIILFFTCVLINSSSNAQTTTTTNQKKTAPGSSVQLGIKAGVNIANIHRKDDVEYDSRTGFHVGGLAHIHISDQFAVQPEIVYSTQGAENGNEKFKYDYINVPILLQFMTSNGFRLQTGPQAEFSISAKNKTGGIEVDVKEYFNTVTFAWSLGAGYLSKTGLGIDVRYNLGLSKIFKDDVVLPESKNRVWQFGLFYQFMQ